MDTKRCVWLLLITFGLLTLIVSSIRCNVDEDQSSSIVLDEKVRKLALRLMKEFKNRTRLAELIVNVGGEANELETIPPEPVAEIYRNYTLEQIRSMEIELSTHTKFIYQALVEKTETVKEQFDQACRTYEIDRNLPKFEQNFLSTGRELVAVQKMILRIINSRLEEKLINKDKNRRMNRGLLSWFSSLFGRLNSIFVGGFISKTIINNNGTFTESSSRPQSQVNKIFSLIGGLNRSSETDTSSLDIKQSIEQLRTFLTKLRNVYQLNSIASVRNSYLNTENISPYSYQAMLQLVSLVGTTKTLLNNTPLILFRSWMNFFNGGNLFTALTRPLSSSSNSNNQRVSNRYNVTTINVMMKLLQQNEEIQQQKIESNRQLNALNQLITNQNNQQKQINEILAGLEKMSSANSMTSTSTTTISTTTETFQSSTTTTTTTTTKSPVPNQNSILQRLREQRKNLNDLLQQLERPEMNQRPTGNSYNITVNSMTDLRIAQQSLMTIMKTITPIINTMAQNGMVSTNRLNESRTQLLDILNTINNREMDDYNEMAMERVKQLTSKLDSVVKTIISEAEQR